MTPRMQNSSCVGQYECSVRQLFDPYRAGVLFRRSRTYWGARPIYTLNISTAVLYINCSCSARISGAFNFADVDRERSGKVSFAARLWSGSKGVINFPWIFYAMRSLVPVGHFRNRSGHSFTRLVCRSFQWRHGLLFIDCIVWDDKDKVIGF